MTVPEMKTSYEWAIDPVFAGLVILDPDGWNRNADEYEYSFFQEKIPRSEFEKRIMNSTIEWNLPKI